jgi:hypothetical protein
MIVHQRHSSNFGLIFFFCYLMQMPIGDEKRFEINYYPRCLLSEQLRKFTEDSSSDPQVSKKGISSWKKIRFADLGIVSDSAFTVSYL